MKLNLISILFLALIFNSCTTSGLNEGADPAAANTAKAKSIANAGNPYEASGAVFAEIYAKLLDTAAAQDLESILAVSHTVSGFNTLYQAGYRPLTGSQITAVVNSAKNNFDSLFPVLGMSPQGFAKITALANGLQSLKSAAAPYEDAVTFLLNSESELLAATDISEPERKIALITATMVRQRLDVEKRKRRKDRDWELSIGHIAATAYGAAYSEPNAIISGLASLYVE